MAAPVGEAAATLGVEAGTPAYRHLLHLLQFGALQGRRRRTALAKTAQKSRLALQVGRQWLEASGLHNTTAMVIAGLSNRIFQKTKRRHFTDAGMLFYMTTVFIFVGEIVGSVRQRAK